MWRTLRRSSTTALVLLQGAAPQRSVGPHAGSAAPSPPDSDWQEQDYKVHSQLHDDALAGNETAVAELLAAGDMNINRQRGSAYNTPLHNAAHAGHLGVAKLLLEVGAAPISKTDADGVMHVRIGQEFAKIDAQVSRTCSETSLGSGPHLTQSAPCCGRTTSTRRRSCSPPGRAAWR